MRNAVYLASLVVRLSPDVEEVAPVRSAHRLLPAGRRHRSSGRPPETTEGRDRYGPALLAVRWPQPVNDPKSKSSSATDWPPVLLKS